MFSSGEIMGTKRPLGIGVGDISSSVRMSLKTRPTLVLFIKMGS